MKRNLLIKARGKNHHTMTRKDDSFTPSRIGFFQLKHVKKLGAHLFFYSCSVVTVLHDRNNHHAKIHN